jgi:1-acyl-sn-glycerol-3-phosphate acyltransferase
MNNEKSAPPVFSRFGFMGLVFGRIWALWGLLTFIITFLLFFLPSMVAYLIPNPKGQDYFIAVSRWWMRVWLPLVGCPVRVKGRSQFQNGQTYVIVFNHNALIDAPLSAPFVPSGNKTIAKSSFSKVPIFGWFYARGSVLIDRKNEVSRRRSFEEMKHVLNNQMHMCIYPEGTRNRTAEPLKPFYDGAFKLAVDTGKPIMPCIILGTKKAMPANIPFYLFPTLLKMHFLSPVESKGKTAAELNKEVFNRMKNYYELQN